MADERLRIVIEALNRSKGELQALQDDLDGVEVGAEKASPALDGMKHALVGAISVAALKRLGEAAYDLGVLGAEAERVEVSFERLAGGGVIADTMLEDLKEATNGTRSEMELMQGATNLMALGFGDTAAELGQITRNVEALGGRFGGTMQIFQLMMSNNSLARIDSFGIGVEEATERIEAFKEAGMGDGEAFDTAILELMNEKYEELGGTIEDNVTNIDRSKAAWQDLRAEMGQFLSGGVGEANALFGGLTRNLADTLGGINDLADGIDNIPFEKLRLLNLFLGGVDPKLQGELAQEAANHALALEAIASGATAAGQGFSDVGINAPPAAQAIRDTGDAADTAQSAFFDAAAGLDAMSTATFVQTQLEALKELGLEGQAFATAQEAMLRNFGLLTEAEAQAQGTLGELATAFTSGKISVDQYIAAVQLLKGSIDGLEGKDIDIHVGFQVDSVPDLVRGNIGSGVNQRDLLPDIENYATGGFAPVGTTAFVGEQGPELMSVGSQGTTITPLDGGRSGGSLGNTVSISINGAMDPSAVAYEVKRQLKPYLSAVSLR